MSRRQRELTRAYRQGLVAVRSVAAAGVVAAWDRLGSWDESDVDAFLHSTVPRVVGAQAQVAQTTETYMAMSMGGRPAGIDRERYVGAAARNGTPPETVYRRPFQQLWKGLGAGKAWQLAQDEARFRLAQTAVTDLALSTRLAAQDAMASSGIVGYRRVTAAGACQFCDVLSTRRYNVAELMPVHPNCACTVEPITDSAAGGRQIIDQEKYDRLQAQGVEAKVVQHGELGPVVYDAEWNFNSLAA